MDMHPDDLLGLSNPGRSHAQAPRGHHVIHGLLDRIIDRHGRAKDMVDHHPILANVLDRLSLCPERDLLSASGRLSGSAVEQGAGRWTGARHLCIRSDSPLVDIRIFDCHSR